MTDTPATTPSTDIPAETKITIACAALAVTVWAAALPTTSYRIQTGILITIGVITPLITTETYRHLTH